MPADPPAPFRIVFALFPGLTQLDFTGPHQVLHRLPGAQVTVASAAGGEVASDDGLRFAGTTRLADINACELICVPGGVAATEAALDAGYIAEVRRLALGARYITSVCTGSLILGAAGLLTGKRAACHWAWRDMLSLFGATPDESRVVRDGNLFTGGGVTAGIDMALTVLAEIAGPTVAQAVQLSMEYAPHPPFNSGRPELAPEDVMAATRLRLDAMLPTRLAQAQEAAARLAA